MCAVNTSREQNRLHPVNIHTVDRRFVCRIRILELHILKILFRGLLQILSRVNQHSFVTYLILF
jgi:hypothetical protein